MKKVVLGEVLFELFEKLKQETSFAWAPFPAWDELRDFQFVFERLKRLFHLPVKDARLAISLASADRALLTLQGWELPSTFVEVSTPRDGHLATPFDDAFAALEQLALSKRTEVTS
jgi:hypothetical protein